MSAPRAAGPEGGKRSSPGVPPVILRDFRAKDLDALHDLLSDPEVMRFSVSGPMSRFEVRKVLGRLLGAHPWLPGLWAVALEPQGEMLGICGFHDQEFEDESVWELGYRLRRRAWGRGLATEAARQARDRAFGEFGLRRFVSFIEAENVASLRVAEKIGMHHERDGVFRGIPVRVYAIERDTVTREGAPR
jgi:RimJ/RimL family protein N-acetyltransferase